MSFIWITAVTLESHLLQIKNGSDFPHITASGCLENRHDLMFGFHIKSEEDTDEN